MKRHISLLSLLLVSLLLTASCRGNDPIKDKRINIENNKGDKKDNKEQGNGDSPNGGSDQPGGNDDNGSNGDNPGGGSDNPGGNNGGNGDNPGGGSDNPGGNNGGNGDNPGGGSDNPGGNNGGSDQPDQPAPELHWETSTVTYSFEKWVGSNLLKHYWMPAEEGDDTKKMEERFWQSASQEWGLATGYKVPANFPIYSCKGANGTKYGVEIRTVDGSKGMWIVPGELYCGSIDRSRITLDDDAPQASLYGSPVQAVPQAISLYYQYMPASQLINAQGEKIDGIDQPTVACLFYDVTTDQSYLNGHTLYTDSRVIARLVMHPTPTAKGQWQQLSGQLQILDEAAYQQIDFTKRQYRMVLVFSASARIHETIGADGTILRIDEVSLTMGTPVRQ